MYSCIPGWETKEVACLLSPFFFFFFTFVQKAPPQLHFVLIMKRWFVFITTHRGSCRYQQTVFTYNSPTQPACSQKKTQPLPSTPVCIFCFLSVKQKIQFPIVHCSTKQNFLTTSEVPPFCLLVKSEMSGAFFSPFI